MRDERRRRGAVLTAVQGSLAVTVLFGFLLLSGCGRQEKADVVARVGPRELTTSDLTRLGGRAADSLSKVERWQVVNGWVERTLAELEGERRKFDERPDVQFDLNLLRADLFLSKLLQEIPAPPPTDSMIQAYYAAHRKEFLRPVDAYLIELYWAEHEHLLTQFRHELVHGDTSMIATGDVSDEGRWLAESGELEPQFERELASMKAGEVTFPRPYEDGFRVARLMESYPAGTVLDLSVVEDEIAARLMVEQGRKRQDSLLSALRERYGVTLLLRDSL